MDSNEQADSPEKPQQVPQAEQHPLTNEEEMQMY